MGSTGPSATFPVCCIPYSVLDPALDAAGWLGLSTRHNHMQKNEDGR